MGRWVVLLLVVLLGWALVLPARAGLVPHQAFYRLRTPAGLAPGAPTVAGGLALEWRRTCEGWRSRQRLAFVLAEDGPAESSLDIRFQGFESLDGRRFEFELESFRGLRREERVRGQAELGPAGGRVRLELPRRRELVLPPTTLFPARQLEGVLAAARRGVQLVDQWLYDGSGETGLVRVVTVLGRPRAADGGLRLPFAAAYYRGNAGSPLPALQLWGELDGEGIYHRLVLDFGDLVLEAVPLRIRRLAPPACHRRPAPEG